MHDLGIDELASRSNLSTSRFQHLFKSTLGLPVTNYIQWLRLRSALEAVLLGMNLTQAAYEAGFSDQAHFSRVCANTLGIPPSAVTKNSRYVKVAFQETTA